MRKKLISIFIFADAFFGSLGAFAQSSPLFHGLSQVIWNFNSTTSNSQLPSGYFIWSGDQDFGYKNLPFEITWNMTSAKSYDRLIPNAFSISFDVEQFRKNLRLRAEQQIKAETMNILQNKTKGEQIKHERESIISFFENTQVKEQLAIISRKDSLTELLNKDREKLSAAEVDRIKNEIEQNQAISSNRDAFFELKRKANELDSMDKIFSKTDTITDLPHYDFSELQHINQLKKELSKRGKISKLENAGLIIQRFQFGRFAPLWENNILRGVTVDGAEIAVSPANFYAGIIAGSLYPWQMLGLPSQDMPFQRTVLGTKIGYGQENFSNLRIHVLQFKDKPDTSFSLYPPSPKANYLINFTAEAHALNERLFFRTSLTGSQTNNTRLENNEPLLQTGQITIPAADNPKQWLQNILYQNQNSLTFSTDKAFDAEIKIKPFSGGPEISTEYKQYGTYYQSFGSPFLPSDFRMIKSGVEQSISNNRIFLLADISNFRDNLSKQKKYTSTWNIYSGGIKIMMPANVQLTSFLRSVQQKASADPFALEDPQTFQSGYLNHFYSIQASQLWLKNFWKSLSSVNLSGQINNSDFTNSSLMASNSISSPSGHRISSSFTAVFSGTRPLLSFQVTPHVVLYKKWWNGLGFSYYSYSSFVQNGIHYETLFKVSEKINFSLRTDYKMSDTKMVGGRAGNIFFLTSRILAYW